MERVVLPFSGLASWVLILGGMLATLQVLGINIQPLLTVGGVSGIVVGLSAQSVMSNMISGINLVSTAVQHSMARRGIACHSAASCIIAQHGIEWQEVAQYGTAALMQQLCISQYYSNVMYDRKWCNWSAFNLNIGKQYCAAQSIMVA